MFVYMEGILLFQKTYKNICIYIFRLLQENIENGRGNKGKQKTQMSVIFVSKNNNKKKRTRRVR